MMALQCGRSESHCVGELRPRVLLNFGGEGLFGGLLVY
jgi:hypothetical protein